MQKILFFLILVLVVPLAVFSQQPNKDDLQKQKKQLEQEINQLNALLESTSKNKKQSIKQLAVIQAKVKKREQLINNISKDIHRVEEQLYANEVKINHLKKELDTLKQNYAKSIVFAYKNRGSYEYLNFLFSAQDFNDAYKRITYLKSYRQYRETQAETIYKTQGLIKDATVTLNTTRTEKTQVLQTQSSQLKALEDDKKENAKVVQQLKDQEKDVQAQLKKREKQRIDLNKALAAALRRAIEEAKEKERLAKIKALEDAKKNQAQGNNNVATKPSATEPSRPKNNEAQTGVAPENNKGRDYNTFESTPEGITRSINFENNKGRLPWPVNGGTVTSEFGIQQVNRIRVENDGIFISVSVGTNVKCVADGQVAAIIPLDDDEAVMVQHGKYFTVYNKLTNVNVSQGQKVNAGTVLGKAAADLTGGGEIEFRVMTDKNKPINPALWLKSR